MGGVIGAMSSKFILQAGVLILSTRIDTHPVRAILDPSTPVTTVPVALASKLGLPAREADEAEIIRRRYISLDRSEFRLRAVRVTAASNAPVVLGADLLAQTPMSLDFARERLSVSSFGAHGLLERAGLAVSTRGLTPIPVAVTPEGCISLAGQDADGRPTSVALLGSANAFDLREATIAVRFGTATLQAESITKTPSRCSTSAAIGWESFGRRRIVLDLPHHQLWLS